MSDFKTPPPPTITGTGTGTGNQDANVDLAPVEVMLEGLKQRLEKQQDDVDGWVLLSKSYYHLNRWKEAQTAFDKARALGYTGDWQPLPRIDAFSQSGQSPKNFDSAINFRNYKTDQAADEASSQPASTPAIELKLKVTLNPALKKKLPPNSPVFVFVRAAENSGPPLAVVRKQVDELPFEIVLNDSHAMIAGRSISSVDNVIVGVRISVSGNAERQPGDYEQLSAPIPVDYGNTLELVINDKI
ncbi:MAG: tetratricopeptide repeat protein [Gammaproteobacteria bacterium]|nr:tetratricopeptide repeat protein [Gammaproteobacteria bacterium]